MRMIRPKLAAPQVPVAEDQPAFATLVAAVVRHPEFPARACEYLDEEFEANSIVVAFQPNDAERAQLAAGDAIYISLLTFMRPMPAIMVKVGPDDMCRIFNVERDG